MIFILQVPYISIWFDKPCWFYPGRKLILRLTHSTSTDLRNVRWLLVKSLRIMWSFHMLILKFSVDFGFVWNWRFASVSYLTTTSLTAGDCHRIIICRQLIDRQSNYIAISCKVMFA